MFLSFAKTASIILETLGIGSTKNEKKLITTTGSMTEFLSDYIIEPTIVVSETVINSASYKDVLTVNINMFSTLWMNTFTNLVNIEGVKPDVAFKLLSTKASTPREAVKSWKNIIAHECDNLNSEVILNNLMFAVESDTTTFTNESYMESLDNIEFTNEGALVKDRSGKHAQEPTMLTKNLEVSVTVDGNTFIVPVIIRALIVVVDTDTIKDYVSIGTKSNSIRSAWRRYKSGVDTFSDFFFATKLNKEHSRLVKGDKHSVLKLLDKRKLKSLGKEQAAQSFSREYGSLIISASEVRGINTTILGDINDESDKDDLLYRIATYNVSVMDDAWETAKFYTTNVSGVSILHYSDLKSKKDDKILDALMKSVSTSNTIRL